MAKKNDKYADQRLLAKESAANTKSVLTDVLREIKTAEDPRKALKVYKKVQTALSV